MKNLERFVNFSDAVMAIAVTLLVLPLVERATNAHIHSYSEFMSSFSHLLLIFLLSFVVICRYWEVHHDIFNGIKSFNVRLFWLNAAWLISVALIPFTSELIGNDTSNSTFITSLYIGSLLITGYVGVAMQWEIAHSSSLQKSSAANSLGITYGLASAIAMTVALAVSILLPSVGIWSLLLVIPASHVRSLTRRQR
jgi:uncharacterized membrane protein